jgi:hypothetical protein
MIQYLPFIKLSFPQYAAYPAILGEGDPLNVALNDVCDRAVLTQSFVLVLAQGHNYHDLKNNIANEELLRQYTQDESQKINFQVFCGNR